MALFYEIDIQTPTTVHGDDGWRPVMENQVAVRRFEPFEVASFLEHLSSTNAAIPFRVRQVITNSRIRRVGDGV
ncbi:MAG TPA: hypothetical protein PKZ07_15990 [Sedimentisphaerales bacterium]|nr:hypothetical protein [Sedimentisphaerales bacterium]